MPAGSFRRSGRRRQRRRSSICSPRDSRRSGAATRRDMASILFQHPVMIAVHAAKCWSRSMAEPNAILEQLRAARAAHDDARRQTQAARIRQTALRREAQRLARQADRGAREQVDRALQASRAAIAEFSAKQDSAERAVSGLVADLHLALTPEALTQLWSAEIPILLLPLRVETRFKGSELLVRVFPDEIAIDTHEEIPTKNEVDAGHAYWRDACHKCQRHRRARRHGASWSKPFRRRAPPMSSRGPAPPTGRSRGGRPGRANIPGRACPQARRLDPAAAGQGATGPPGADAAARRHEPSTAWSAR